MSQVEAFVLDVEFFCPTPAGFIISFIVVAFSRNARCKNAGSGSGSSPGIDCGVDYKLATFHDKFFIAFSRLVFSSVFVSWRENFDVQIKSEPSPRHGFPTRKSPLLPLKCPSNSKFISQQLDMGHHSITKMRQMHRP